jgi:hypothetical protein
MPGITSALGNLQDTELVDMSASHRASSQHPMSTESAI